MHRESYVHLILLIVFMTVGVPSGPPPAMANELPASANVEAQKLYEEAVTLVKESLDAEHLTKALALLDRAARIDPKSEAIWVEISWRCWLLGEDSSKESKKDRKLRMEIFEKGLAAGENAMRVNKNSVGGIYWYTVNLAARGEMQGVMSSLALTGIMLINEGRVDRLDPDYLYGATRRLLSEIFVRVPGWLAKKFGFKPQLVEEDLLENIEKWPYFFSNYTFLARVYVWAKDKEKALDQLDFVLKGPADRMPEEKSENEREQGIARRMWKEYTGKEYPAR